VQTSAVMPISEAVLHEVPPMHDDQSRPDTVPDDFDKAARINFRDYPSSALVAIAALTSGLAWLLYKRRSRKSATQPTNPDDIAAAKGSVQQAKPLGGDGDVTLTEYSRSAARRGPFLHSPSR
jgi:hypothetical protein